MIMIILNTSGLIPWHMYSRPKLARATLAYALYISVGQTKAMLTTFQDEVRTKYMVPHSDWLTVAPVSYGISPLGDNTP